MHLQKTRPVAEMPGGELFAWVAVSTEEGAWHCHPSSALTEASGGDVPLLCSTGSSVTISHSWLFSTVTASQTWTFKQIPPGLLCIRGTTAGQKWPQVLSHQSFSFFPFCKRASAEEPWGADALHGRFPAEGKLFWTSVIESAFVPNSEDKVFCQAKLRSGSSPLAHWFRCKATYIYF